MRFRRAGLPLLIAGAALGCPPGPSTGEGDTPPRAASGELSRDDAVRRARDFVIRHGAAQEVYLDSTRAEAVDSLWRVTFRRRALIAPAVLTVDVHRWTGALRFPGDE
jgi:hypothetical protein